MSAATRSWRKYFTVEPVLFLYAYGLLMHVPVIQQYIYFRVSEIEGFSYNSVQEQGCGSANLNATMKELEKKVTMIYHFDDILINCTAVCKDFRTKSGSGPKPFC